jgi:hypothetical protein
VVIREKWTANIAGRPGSIFRVDFPNQEAQVTYLDGVVKQYRGAQTIRDKAMDIVFNEYHCQPRALACHAAAIGDWVQKNIRYVNEGTETFATPIQTLRLGYEDCDGHSCLIRSLCESLGIVTQFCALKWDGGYQHIYARALVPIGGKKRWLPLDSTLTEPIGTNPLIRACREHKDVKMLCVPR